MDGLPSSRLPTPVRSRSSQSAASPSHSASASATSSSLRKRRKLSTTLSTGGTPNEDIDSVSANVADTDDEDESGEEDDESMVDFTASRLDKNDTNNNNKVKTENGTVKVEDSSTVKDVGNGVDGAVVKEDGKSVITTDSVQTSGAYSAREEMLKREEAAGRLKFVCASNDGTDEHMVWLIGLKGIFAKQLPNMPREYIVRLLMDRNHKSVMVIRRNMVVGGITYRPYASQKFGEIAFCAITSDEQVKGYGTRLMNHLKQHARDVDSLTHFLTYADNNAVGYFVKQGFTKEIHLEKERWHGYIKDYDGGILMECKIDPKLPYTDLSTMIRRQRLAIDEKIRELSNCHIVYPGIDFQKKEAGVPKKPIKVEEIPGLREAGWTPDQYGYSRSKPANLSTDAASHQKSLTALMRSLVKAMHDHPDAWPFKEPVDARDVPDYYEIIKDPMDLKTMSKRVESEQYYITFEMFTADARRMFSNARTYNSPETIYYKCSTRLEGYFSNKVQAQAGLQSCVKIPPS